MLHGFGKPTHDADGNKISYQASLHNLRRFWCYASILIPEDKRRGDFGLKSKPCMIVGHPHDSKTLWRIWDPEFQKVKAQWEVIFNKERNAYMSCLHQSNQINTDMFGLSKDEEYIEETDTGDEPLRRHNSDPTLSGKRSTSHMHKAPDEEAENAHSRRLRREDQTAQCSAADPENITDSRRLRRKYLTARRSAAAIKKSCQVPPAAAATAPPSGSRFTRSQGETSAEASTASGADPFTYIEAMESPQRDHWKRATKEESTSILLNITFSALNSWEARQLQVKPIGSKRVYKTKRNPHGSTQYKALLVIKGYEQTDFGETYPPVG